MPVYNGGKYLADAIESILNQTHRNFEFIIINDGSTDESLEIIEQYKNQDKRIVLITRENKGLVASLNEGLEIAKGKYIARMDADDISINTRFEKQINLLEKTKLDVVGSHFIIVDDSRIKQRAVFMPIKEELISLQFLNTVPVAHPAAMINREFLVKHKLKYEDMPAEDYHLWARMYSLGAKFSNCDDFLLLYRKNPNSFSSTKRLELKNDRKMIINNFFKKNSSSVFKAIQESTIKEQSYCHYEREIIMKAIGYIVFNKYYFKYLKEFRYFFNKSDIIDLINYLRSLR